MRHENANINERSEWVTRQMAHLEAPEDYQPDAVAALRRFHVRANADHTPVSWLRWPAWAAVTVAAFGVVLSLPVGRAAAQQFWRYLTVRRIAFVPVGDWPEGVPSPQVKLLGTVIPPIPARDAAEAEWRVHYAPRLPRTGVLPGSPRLSTTFGMAAGLSVKVADLQLALRKAGITDQSVPPEWDGAQVALHTSSLVIAEWPNAALVQSMPLTLTTPPGFDFSVFSALTLRILGVAPDEAERLARRTGTVPLWLAPVDRQLYERATMEEITLSSGPATLLEEKSKNGTVEKTVLFWSVADRVYLLIGTIGRQMSILVADAVQ